MNPATRALLKQIDSASMASFVDAWDELELLVVEIYRGGAADEKQGAQYSALQTSLGQLYPQWEEGMRPHWQVTRINGELVEEDPFRSLSTVTDAAEFVDNWAAMQQLPAAREALNGFLMEMIEGGGAKV